MATVTPIRKLTAAEYLQIERAAETKSEFWDGEMFAMAGASLRHNRICANLIRHFGNRLHGGPCFAYTSDLRVKVEMADAYVYPDVSVICGEIASEPGQNDVILNPTLVVEVMSDSTERYDRGPKFELYRRIPTLQEYLMVSQRKPAIEQYVRQPAGHWLFHEVEGLDAVLSLPSLNLELPLADIFSKVDFH